MRILDCEQGSYEWHCARQGMVTGTTLGSALGTEKVQTTLMYHLLAERMTEPLIVDLTAPAVVRGKEMEPVARRVVIEHTGIDFEETGMMLADFPGYGISPDSVFRENGEIVGGLELKCPGSKKHIEYTAGGVLPKEYATQVKAPFLLSDSVKWWYFASYDDRNYELPLFIIRLTREDFPSVEADREKLQMFINRVADTHTEMTF